MIFAGVVTYFLITFLVYAASDFIVWQRSYDELIEKLKFEEAKRQYEAEKAGATNVVISVEPVNKRKETWRSILRRAIAPTSMIRASVEFFVPLGVGLFALFGLLRAAAR